MKKSYIIALVIFVLAMLWMASGFIERNGTAETADPETSRSLSTVKEVQIQTLTAEDHLQHITVNGRTAASRTAHIAAEIAGQIEEILAEDGEQLERGEAIATIRVNDREAALESARNRVLQYELEFETARNLVSRGFSTEVQVATRRAELEEARANRRRAELDLENTKIRAPFGGILDQRMVESGDYVQTGDQVALFLDLDPIHVIGHVAEQRIHDINIGQPGAVTLPDGTRHQGHIRHISRIADDTTRTFQVELEIANPDLVIADGLTAEMRLEGQRRRAYRITPAILTLSSDGAIGIKYVDDQQRVRFKPVSVTASQSDAIWVTGLPDPVRVIVIGQDFVEEGQSVTAVEATTDAVPDAETDLTPNIPIMEESAGERAD